MNEIKKYNKIYNEILFEDIKPKDLFKKIFNTVILINDTDKINLIYENTILEMAGTIKDSNRLSKYINSIKSGSFINKKILLENLENDWTYFNLIKKSSDFKFHVFKFNFLSNIEIGEFYNKFYSKYYKNENIDNFIKDFKQIYNDKQGIFTYDEDSKRSWFLFNTNPFNRFTNKTILHEFTHFLQCKYNVEINDEEFKDFDKYEHILKMFNINKNMVSYLLMKEEFYPHLNDLCNILKLIFISKNNKYDEFLLEFYDEINTLKNIKDVLNKKILFKIIDIDNNESLLYFIILVFKCHFKENFVKNVIEKEIKNDN